MEQVSAHFVLYGGTAIVLHLGHRQSVDFDFFSSKTFSPMQLLQELPLLSGATILQQAPNTLSCRVDRGEPVQVSFFGTPSLQQVQAPAIAPGIGIRIASLVDLAGMKVAVAAVDLDRLPALQATSRTLGARATDIP